LPSTSYDYDVNGKEILDSNNSPVWSPLAPATDLQSMANTIGQYMSGVSNLFPISVVLNGGERLLDVCGFDCPYWGQDPNVAASKATSGLSWEAYISQQKAKQEMFFTNMSHTAAPTAAYVWYSAGGNPYRADACSEWEDWDWDYKDMHTVEDYPSQQAYWAGLGDNSGYTGHWQMNGCLGQSNNDMLSQALNAVGYAITFNQPLSYNWVNDGSGSPLGDIVRYYGFLKAFYTAGMIGGVAGYFNYPTGGFDAQFDANFPPHWLLQIAALGEVHAEFSYLEDILRNGSLLPGPDMNPKEYSTLPAYEFRTSYADTRVLARKMNGYKRWLITAWAADDVKRAVNVIIPVLGNFTLQATPAANVYDARVVGGVMSLTLLDSGSMGPTPLNMPSTPPDADSAGYVTYSLNISTVGNGVVFANSVAPCGVNGGPCSETLGSGTNVTLTATASYGYVFTGWSGGGCSGTGACVVTMNSNQTVTATFNIGTSPVLYGDVNGDGNVTINDAELTAQYAIGLPVANFILTNAEVDGNKYVNIDDAFLIAEYAVGLISKFPVQ